MNFLGDFPVNAMVYVPFHSFDSNGASVTITGLAVTDIEIYKDGSTTQRASDNGYTLLDTDGIDFDGITGIHGFSIDLSDNSDPGFYAAGHEYMVVVSSITVDAQTVNFIAATFSIERSGGALALLKNGTYGLSALNTDIDAVLADTGTDGVVIADGAITAAKIAADAIGASELAADAATEIADAILKRDWTAVSGEAARSVLNALRFLRNKWSISGTTLTVTKEDDSTPAWTGTVTTDAAADPITANDPT